MKEDRSLRLPMDICVPISIFRVGEVIQFSLLDLVVVGDRIDNTPSVLIYNTDNRLDKFIVERRPNIYKPNKVVESHDPKVF